MNREDVELLLRSTRPAAAPGLRTPQFQTVGSGAPRLQIALAAAFLLAVVLVIAMTPGAASRPEPSGRRWLLPVEISSVTEDLGGAAQGSDHLVRTSSGGAALITDWRVWVSRDGKAPWKKIRIPGWHPSEPVVEGDRVSFLTVGPPEYVTVDVASGELVSQVRLPKVDLGPHGYKEWTAYLAAVAADRFAVRAGLGGSMMFLRSADGGRTWTEPREIARTGQHQLGLHNPAFLSAAGALWLFYVGESGRIDVRRSVDQGDTWSPFEGPPAPPEFGRPDILRATAIGDTIHLICLTDQRRVLLFNGTDGGRAWSPGSVVMQDLDETYRDQSRMVLRSGGGRLLLSGLRGAGAGPRASDDGGRSWKNVDAFDGIRGSVDLMATFIGGDGSLSIAPRVSLDKRLFLLFRQWSEAAQSAPLDEARLRLADSNIARLSDDDIQVRDRAARDLTALGTAAIPTLRRALVQAADPERRARLSEVIRKIELDWPDAQVPAWWRGAAER